MTPLHALPELGRGILCISHQGTIPPSTESKTGEIMCECKMSLCVHRRMSWFLKSRAGASMPACWVEKAFNLNSCPGGWPCHAMHKTAIHGSAYYYIGVCILLPVLFFCCHTTLCTRPQRATSTTMPDSKLLLTMRPCCTGGGRTQLGALGRAGEEFCGVIALSIL